MHKRECSGPREDEGDRRGTGDEIQSLQVGGRLEARGQEDEADRGLGGAHSPPRVSQDRMTRGYPARQVERPDVPETLSPPRPGPNTRMWILQSAK